MAATNEYEYFVDLVCEGGGVKGIGLAGAFSLLEERGYKPQNLAGTSAGAITAALIAAGYSASELKDIIFGLDFRQFEDKSWEDRHSRRRQRAERAARGGRLQGRRLPELDAHGARRQRRPHVRRT